MEQDNYTIQFNHWANKPESKLKKEIKYEKSEFRRKELQQIYTKLKSLGVYKKNKKGDKQTNGN